MTTAVIGLGNMGRAIAERLADEGETLAVWNRTPGKAAGIAGATEMATPLAAAQAATVTISVLANDAAIEAAYFGPGGICTGDLSGRTIVELCTTSPETAERLEREVAAKGGQFLECPVGGTIGPARDGALLGLAGGSDAAFAAARPILQKLTRRLEHLGPAGCGAAMKLAINLPLMVYWSALGEAVGLTLAKGIPPALAMDILSDSSGAIGAAKKRVPPLRAMLEEGDPGEVSFSLTNAIKDMKLMEALAESSGHPAPVIATVRAKAEAARDGGWGDYDNSLVGMFGKSVGE